jgi:hypothetical protein
MLWLAACSFVWGFLARDYLRQREVVISDEADVVV